MLNVTESSNGYLIYASASEPKQHPIVRVWLEDLEAIAQVCQLFPKICKASFKKSDYSLAALRKTLAQLNQAKQQVDQTHPFEAETEDEQDDYLDLTTAIEDLTAIVRRIEGIEHV